MIGSRAQWLQLGDKPTQYFCGLEHKNFVDKTIKKMRLENGQVITTQAEILEQVRLYYENLFKSKDRDLPDVDLDNLLRGYPIKKLEETDIPPLEGLLTACELGEALNNMKHNKTPGIDGFPAEFLKVFWGKIKFLITRVLNYSYKKGKLPISL